MTHPQWQPVPLATWQRKAELVSWDFVYPKAPFALGEVVEHVLRAVTGFALPREFRLTTASKGDDTEVLAPAAESLRAAFARHDDVVMVEGGLDLLVRVPSGEGRIDNGADLWVMLDDEDEPVGALRLRLSLDVDVYALHTRGVEEDNRTLAGANAPRIQGFLQRLRDLGWQLRELEAVGYLREEAEVWTSQS